MAKDPKIPGACWNARSDLGWKQTLLSVASFIYGIPTVIFFKAGKLAVDRGWAINVGEYKFSDTLNGVLKASDFRLRLFAKPINVFSIWLFFSMWLFIPSPFSCSGGGFHHCSSDKGGGFCAYADITLAIKVRTTLKPLFSAVCANGGEIHINS